MALCEDVYGGEDAEREPGEEEFYSAVLDKGEFAVVVQSGEVCCEPEEVGDEFVVLGSAVGGIYEEGGWNKVVP